MEALYKGRHCWPNDFANWISPCSDTCFSEIIESVCERFEASEKASTHNKNTFEKEELFMDQGCSKYVKISIIIGVPNMAS